MKQKASEVIIIGDSTHNTLGAVRSFAEAGVNLTLILVGKEDTCHLEHSRRLRHGNLHRVANLEEAGKILDRLPANNQLLVCTFDAAAMWVDEREATLSSRFRTPGRGHQIGALFSKDAQCRLAEECGLTVPASKVVTRAELEQHGRADRERYPLLLKPLVSVEGEKSDIHICHTQAELSAALSCNSRCSKFIVQEYIEKEYELNCIGLVTDDEVIIAGGIEKLRHYPAVVGACTYGIFHPLSELNINYAGIEKFLRESGYHGPLSIEFLHTADGENYFLEVNFRNDGLAYASTSAGANLYGVYAGVVEYDAARVRRIYMMNYSLDYLFVKSGEIGKLEWWRDFLRTRSFININFRDLGPTLAHYSARIRN